MGPEIDVVHGVHPTATINVFKGNVNRNEPSSTIHQYGRNRGKRGLARGDNILKWAGSPWSQDPPSSKDPGETQGVLLHVYVLF